MSLFQKGLSAQVSAFVTRRRPTTPSVSRSPLRRVRHPRRNQSSEASKPEPQSQKKAVEDGPSGEATASSPAPAPQPTPAGVAAGAATTVVQRRGFGDLVKATPLGTFGRWYARAQQARPYTTQLCSSVIIYLFGDLSAQMFFPPEIPVPAEEGQQLEPGQPQEYMEGSYDPWRTLRHLCVGATSSIPSYKWFMFLHNNFNFSSKALSVLTKVVVQQICFTPVFNTYFFGLHSLLGGATLEETVERVKRALPVSIQNSIKLWPAVTAFSFMYVPPEFRNVFSGVIAVGWQTYLSWLNQTAARQVREAEAAAAAQLGGASVSGALIPASAA
ncbi:hypothetical protein N7468_002426 [Penicillium chermesinum]|uniref:Uncharacterized protein n=1 Tax=Penicillium chermesinum TaxID=63820 RepID=A0A9W9PIH5_9EURO|nr:uncharacterized protein N7468_002426 [Penicillium chermesinum]KAJ5247443.1 hypothetical protein N7468_002426 [Penicillium chermesinum]KAJ6145681.1 hypothetical protein N7470_009576 [Penicillium chermesinum]